MDKAERLKDNRTYNERYDQVGDAHFVDAELFDPRDVLQVRYEMVRAVALGESPERVGKRFGASGMTVRRYVQRFVAGGMLALMPSQRGPKGPRALGAEGEAFVDAYLLAHPRAHGREVHEALEATLALGVSQRTVERRMALARRENGR